MKSALGAEGLSKESDTVLRMQVRAFQSVFQAMASPGRVVSTGIAIPTPPGLNCAAAAICLTWLNTSTPFWTDIPWDAPAVHWIQNHSEAALVTEPCLSTLALITDPATMPSLNDFRIGAARAGSISATIIIQVDDPGRLIHTEYPTEVCERRGYRARQGPDGLPAGGVDILLTCRDCIVVPGPPTTSQR
jgi:phosphonate C-P lyase system protein PhnH